MKKFKIKSFFANHIEKLVFAAFGLFVVMALANTTWGRYPQTPEKLKLDVSNVKDSITDPKNVWPDRAQYKVVDFSDKAHQLFSPIDVERFRMQTPLFHALNKIDEPRREPIFEPVQSLITSVALVPLGVRDQEDDPLLTTPEQSLTAATTPTDDVDSDFKPRGSVAGSPGTAAPGAATGIPLGGRMGRNLFNQSQMDDDERAGAGGGGGGAMAPGYAPGRLSGVKPRGVRVIAVRGVFPLQKQLQHYIDALHVTKPEASRDFELADFVLERQVAVPGPDPWKDVKWQPVRVESAWDVLLESVEIDREDPVPFNMKDPVVTMELPYRLIGTWDKLASHPRIDHELLTKKELDQQNQMLDALEQTAAENGMSDKPLPRKRGLANYQGDPKAMAKAMKGNPQIVAKIQAAMNPTRTPVPGAPPGSAPTVGRVVDDEDHPFAMGGGGGFAPAMNAMLSDANYLLFRYLDFDVQSGYAYRYRVRLKFHNPNFEAPPELLGGADPSIANGQERESPWSNTSNPQIVPQTTNYFLEDVGRDPYREEKLRQNEAIPAAMVSIFDWDTKYGSVVASDPMNPPKVLNIGSYIGDKYLDTKERKEVKEKEEKKKVERRQTAAFGGSEMAQDDAVAGAPAQNPSLKDERKKKEPPKRNELKILDFKEGGLVTRPHYFSTLDVLLDVEPDAEIQPDQHPELKIAMEKVKGGGSRIKLLEEALVTTSNGELKILDPITTLAEKEMLKDRVARERKSYTDVELAANRGPSIGRMSDEEERPGGKRPPAGRRRRLFGRKGEN